ncbi:MAG: phage tail protein [Cyanobacteria bacterium P01_C01_bin.118]
MVYLPQPDVDLTLVPQVPINWNSDLNGTGAPAPEEVLLEPGKLTEVTARIKNNSAQELWVSLGVQGNFPDAWFTPVHSGQGTEDEILWEPGQENLPVRQSVKFGTNDFRLLPRQTIAINLGFTLPESFFEDLNRMTADQSALMGATPNIPLGYGSEIFLHQIIEPEQNSTVQLIAYKTLQLYPRPERIYQQFLPEFYQESDFLGRFLNITEQAFEPVYEAAETFWSYLDPLLTPKALVPFLAHWVAWPMNPRLTLSQQRRLIRHAVEIYQWRGTAHGLKLCLRLCTNLTDEQIEVIEPNQREFAVGDITLGDQPRLGGGKAYHFVVVLKPDTQDQLDQLDEAAIRVLIEQEKPAFCTYALELMHPATASPANSSPPPPSIPLSPPPTPYPVTADGSA